MRIKKGDIVLVRTGNSGGTRGRVLAVDHAKGKLVVEGVNIVQKHVRRSQKNPQGGRVAREMPIPASNVMYVCSSCGAPTRIGVRFASDGAKERYCKKCDAAIGQVSPAKS